MKGADPFEDPEAPNKSPIFVPARVQGFDGKESALFWS